jgi:penicillin V acylase-like amidase (Ntn superfamily)
MCARAVYLGPSGTVITARSMDWVEDIRTNLWSLPRKAAVPIEPGHTAAGWPLRCRRM